MSSLPISMSDKHACGLLNGASERDQFDSVWVDFFRPLFVRILRRERIPPVDYHLAFEKAHKYILWNDDLAGSLTLNFIRHFDALLREFLCNDVLPEIFTADGGTEDDSSTRIDDAAVAERYRFYWLSFVETIKCFPCFLRIVDETFDQRQAVTCHPYADCSAGNAVRGDDVETLITSSKVFSVALICWRVEIFEALEPRIVKSIERLVKGKFGRTATHEKLGQYRELLTHYRNSVLMLDDVWERYNNQKTFSDDDSSACCSSSVGQTKPSSLYLRAFVQPYFSAIEYYLTQVAAEEAKCNDVRNYAVFAANLFDAEFADGIHFLGTSLSNLSLLANTTGAKNAAMREHYRAGTSDLHEDPNVHDTSAIGELRCILRRTLVDSHLVALKAFAVTHVELLIEDEALNTVCRLLKEYEVDSYSQEAGIESVRAAFEATIKNKLRAIVREELLTSPVAGDDEFLSSMPNIPCKEAEVFVSTLIQQRNLLSSYVERYLSCDEAELKKTIKRAFIYSLNIPPNTFDQSLVQSEGVINVEKTAVRKRPSKFGSGSNVTDGRSSHLLATYLDGMLRSSYANSDTADVDRKIRDALTLVEFIKQKNIFVQYYRSDLSRRLLLNVSRDIGREESVIMQLRSAGVLVDDIARLMRMCRDVASSGAVSREFQTFRTKSDNAEHETKTDADFAWPLSDNIADIKIVNASAWRSLHTASSATFDDAMPSQKLPAMVEEVVPEVERFYNSRHKGRRLRLIPHFSSAELAFTTRQGCIYDLEVSLLQLSILTILHGRNSDYTTFTHLLQTTGVAEHELRLALLPLVANRSLSHHQILLCMPVLDDNQEITEQTEFCVNHDFALYAQNQRTKHECQTNETGDEVIRNHIPLKRGKISLFGLYHATLEPLPDDDAMQSSSDRRARRVQQTILNIMQTKLSARSLMMGDDSADDQQQASVLEDDIQMQVVDMLKAEFVPSVRQIREQIEHLVMEVKCIKRDPSNSKMLQFVIPSSLN